jgi:hypothetical protein
MATLVVVPAYWSILAGVVSLGLDDDGGMAHPELAIAFGLALLPFSFVVLAVYSEQPRVPIAVAQALGAAVLVGVPVSALAGDAVTGLVGSVGAGGIFALRPVPDQGWRPRVAAVVLVCASTFVLAQVSPPLAVVPAPVLPFAALGLADRRVERAQHRALLGG